MSEATVDLTIRKTVTVAATPERAFDVFTRGIASWWPLETHSVWASRHGLPPQELHLELRKGGRFYERTEGEEHEWGAVLAYEPPQRIVIEWRVNPANPPTEVEVTFTADGDRTRVELVHRGWEAFDDPAHATRANYGGEGGWTQVLARYADAVAA